MAMMMEPEQKSKEEPKNEGRKPYVKPEIIHDLELETRAGSFIDSFPDPLDLEQ
jgi:hypothetical protein